MLEVFERSDVRFLCLPRTPFARCIVRRNIHDLAADPIPAVRHVELGFVHAQEAELRCG
jgi:hypothetical protein